MPTREIRYYANFPINDPETKHHITFTFERDRIRKIVFHDHPGWTIEALQAAATSTDEDDECECLYVASNLRHSPCEFGDIWVDYLREQIKGLVHTSEEAQELDQDLRQVRAWLDAIKERKERAP